MFNEVENSPGLWRVAGSSLDVEMAGVLMRDVDRGMWQLTTYVELGERGRFAERGAGPFRLWGTSQAGALTAPKAYRVSTREKLEVSEDGSYLRRAEEVWIFSEVITGGHFSESQRWSSLKFNLPHMESWFSEIHPPERFDEFNGGEVSAEYKDYRVSSWWSMSSQMSQNASSSITMGGFLIEREEGFLLDEVTSIEQALLSLYIIVFGGPVVVDQLYLLPYSTDDSRLECQVLRATQATGLIEAFLFPFIDLADVSFENLIPKWLELHHDAPHWPSISSLPGSKSYLQSSFIEAVTAAESVANFLIDDEDEISDIDKSIIDNTGEVLNSAERRRLVHCLGMFRRTLESKLTGLASLAARSVQRLPIENVAWWAQAVARARNILVHGLPGARESEIDPNLLMDLELSIRVVQKLAMLNAAGYSYTPGEAPDVFGRRRLDSVEFKNRNSLLGHDIFSVESLLAARVRADGVVSSPLER